MDKIFVDFLVVGEVDGCVNREENMEFIYVVLKDEDISENLVVVEGCVILVDIRGNEVFIVVDVVVVVFIIEFSVDLEGNKVWDFDVIGILFYGDVFVGLDTVRELIDRLCFVREGDIFVLLKDMRLDIFVELLVLVVFRDDLRNVEVCRLLFLFFEGMGGEVKELVVMMFSVVVEVVWVVMVVFLLERGVIVKLEYVVIILEVGKVDFDIFFEDEVKSREGVNMDVREFEGRLDEF